MFNLAQTFFLDKTAVQNAPEAGISRIDLYFRGKPKETNNKSGIEAPGVEVFISECINGIPAVSELSTIRPNEPTEHGARFAPRFEIARKEWGEIIASDDASIPTTFKFKNPVFVQTNREYAIIVKYDGNEDFVLWYSRQGDKLLGTDQVSPGPSGKYIGNFFNFISSPDIDPNPGSTALGYTNTSIDALTSTNPAVAATDTNPANPVYTPDVGYLQANWKPINNTDLKFKVYVARYLHNSVPVDANGSINTSPYANVWLPPEYIPTRISNNVVRIIAPSHVYEYITFDYKHSDIDDLSSGEPIFQDGPSWPGGTPTPLTISVANGSTVVTANGSYVLANGATFNGANGWNMIYSGADRDEFIIVKSGNLVNVRKISGISSNTVLEVDEPFTFTNTAAVFLKSPVGELLGVEDTYSSGVSQYMMILSSSNANGSVRFVNNTILSVDIDNGGSGYSNSDYLVINGYESVAGKITGGYPAYANIVTNTSGGITAVYVSNAGAGFVNTAWLTGSNVVVSNSSGNPSTGSNAQFSFNIGAILKGGYNESNNYFSNCVVINLEASRLKPEITVNNPLGTTFTIKHRTLFYSVYDDSVHAGKVVYARSNTDVSEIPVKIFQSHSFASNTDAILPSRSNEFVINFANGAATNTAVIGNNYSNSSVYIFDVSSNNDFNIPFFEPDIIHAHFSKYIINNDYTNEHTNYGNAYAKHVTTKVNFANDRFAEDLLVYLTAYRPAGTDIKVYARIHNSRDPEAFDDKDWTLLEEIDGIGVYSSLDDSSDFIELTYGFPAAPNTQFVLTGSGFVENTTTTTVIGSETQFSSQLAANDLIKIYQPLFPNNYVVAVVDSIANNTSLTIRKPVANNGLVGDGLIIEKLEFKHQAFNNLLNDNVVRYYNEEMVEFDGYDTFQLKLVMLSESDHIVPKIDDVRAIGVTA